MLAALAVIKSLSTVKKSLLIFFVVWFSLVVVIPLSMVIAMGAFIDGFVPSKKLFNYANYLNIFNLIFLIFTFSIVSRQANSIVSRQANSRELISLKVTKKSLLIYYFFAWVVLAALSYVFFSGPLSYLLHKANDTRYGFLIEDVTRTTELYKRCNRHLRLDGDFLIYNRKICDASLVNVKELHNGGQVKMVGYINDYGISSFSYSRVGG